MLRAGRRGLGVRGGEVLLELFAAYAGYGFVSGPCGVLRRRYEWSCRKCITVACVAVERVGGDGEYAAYVDADRGEDTAGADSAAKPLVERSAVCDGAWAGDVGDGLWR